MMRFGIISELGEGDLLGFARVHFDERGEVASDWLPLPSLNTRTVKRWNPVEVNSQVACQMDENCEQGYISMVLWSATDGPPEWAGDNTIGILFADGTEVYYDAVSHTLTANAPEAELNLVCKTLNITGEVNITGDTTITGDTAVDGNIDVTKDVTAQGEVTASPNGIALSTHPHPTAVGPTSPPVPTPKPAASPTHGNIAEES